MSELGNRLARVQAEIKAKKEQSDLKEAKAKEDKAQLYRGSTDEWTLLVSDMEKEADAVDAFSYGNGTFHIGGASLTLSRAAGKDGVTHRAKLQTVGDITPDREFSIMPKLSAIGIQWDVVGISYSKSTAELKAFLFDELLALYQAAQLTPHRSY